MSPTVPEGYQNWGLGVVAAESECPCLETMQFGQAETISNGIMGQNLSGDLCLLSKELLFEVVFSCDSERVHNWLLMTSWQITLDASFPAFFVSTQCISKRCFTHELCVTDS